jgi:hypothetical protein
MKTYAGLGVKLPLDGSERPVSYSLLYSWGMNLQYPLGGCMGIRTDLDAMEKRKVSYPCWESNPNSQFFHL